MSLVMRRAPVHYAVDDLGEWYRPVPASVTRAPRIGNRLLQSVSLLRSAAPSHSRLGVRSAMSARRAAAWHARL